MTQTSFPSVVVLSGAEAGAVLNIDEVLNDFSIGSDEGCHLTLTGASVSPMHAAVFLDDEGQVTLSDSKSRAGVFVNGTKVTEHVLADGDEISLGPPGKPGSGQLRFSAQGGDAPLIDLSDSGAGDLPGFESLEAPALDASLAMPEASDALFTPEAAAFEPFAPVEEFPPAEEFPPLEMSTDLAAAEPEPPPPPPPPAPKPVAKPAALKPAPPGPVRGATAAPARRAQAKKDVSEDSDDPLAGLAESLGASGQRFEPPPAVADTPPPAAKTKKVLGMTPAVMAVRLLVIAVVLGVLARYALKKYSDSIVVPVVDTYLPNPAEPGQTVTINGSGFDPDPAALKVALGQADAQILDADANRINIRIPESLGAFGTQTLPLRVTSQGSTSTSRLLKIEAAPKIVSLAPRVALTGDEVAIVGKWLANPKNKPKVTVAGNEAEVLEATPARIRIKVPEVAATEGQRISVRVTLGVDVGKEAPLNYGRLPFVESVTPERALPGELITISGLGLGGSDLVVRVGNRTAAVLSASDSEIKMSLPGIRLSEGAGQRDLSVQSNQRTSIAHSVEVLRESASLYSPRFFVEIVEGSRIAVSCELGPVMVLGSDAASLKRAHEAAAKLNTLVSQGRSNRIQFVAGDVVISAAGASVLAVGPADGSGNARSMASVWAVHLTDMFDLFLQGRRPGRTVEISPDGKAYLDIFAAARRRSTDPGIPIGVLLSPDAAWVRSLSALALNPSMGGSQALALLDGYWAGVIEVPGAIQPRNVEISLTATPSGLIGQKTSRRGGLSSDVTLDGLSYARRELRFSFVDSGERLNYVGRLDGDAIEGSVTRANGAKVGALTFKLTR